MPPITHSHSPRPSGPYDSESNATPYSVPPPEAPSNPVTIFPLPQRFAVVQIDPVAMLTMAGLDDAEALAAAKAPVPKKYLVYLEDDPNYVFKLPFINCFFRVYSDTELRVRVRRGDDQFNNNKAISLPLRPHLHLIDSFTPDIATIGEYLSRPRDKPARHPQTAASEGIPSMPPDPHFDALKGRLPALLYENDVPDNRLEGNVHDGEPPSAPDSVPASVPSPVEELLSMNLFGWLPDPATKYIPLVNCWFELEEHLTESTISSPVDLWTEQQRIGAIINAAIVRHNTTRATPKSRPVLTPLKTSSMPPATSPRNPAEKSDLGGYSLMLSPRGSIPS